MTQTHFILGTEDTQSLTNQPIKDNAAKQILQTVFNQLTDGQRTDYTQVTNYEWPDNRRSQRNGYYGRELTIYIGSLKLKVPRTRDDEFVLAVFKQYRYDEEASLASMLKMYVFDVSTHKVSQIAEELCSKSVSKSLVSSLAIQLDPMVPE